MGVRRLDNISIVVSDLEEAVRFFEAVGLAVEGRADIAGEFVDVTLGITGVRSRIAVLVTPDGHGRLELAAYDAPEPLPGAPVVPHQIGMHRVMFTVDDIDATLARLAEFGAAPFGGVARYEDAYRLCYLRGPDGIIVALAEELS